MLSRVKELHYEYCAPKPEKFFFLHDTDTYKEPDENSPEVIAERDSINFYIHLMV